MVFTAEADNQNGFRIVFQLSDGEKEFLKWVGDNRGYFSWRDIGEPEKTYATSLHKAGLLYISWTPESEPVQYTISDLGCVFYRYLSTNLSQQKQLYQLSNG
jgi:hypothetical protein